MKTLIQTTFTSLEQTKLFYEKLNFQIHEYEDLLIANDGVIQISLTNKQFMRKGIVIYSDTLVEQIETVKNEFDVIEIEEGFILSSPCGVWVYIYKGRGKDFLSNSEPSSILGNYAGLSLESLNLDHSIQFWTELGFELQMGSVDQGWLTMVNRGGFILSIMQALNCPHQFFNPSLTYFNGKDNEEVIQKIRDKKVPITEEITYFNNKGIVDNVILRDPMGLGFFIFND
ncbi:hypothetical protein [Flammeovirga sp. SJP92]|uniref:hypothetical protein n=1 Tax=Flammeovirga sp. SJP92 TaxID=1775430 RepID=UPI0007875A53|nr:hypothetical protein [Flammeovirga sp. SJP92]KXX66847.1 hypothetical protein AVL50_30410 [Flammeovirga sp. SJP92]